MPSVAEIVMRAVSAATREVMVSRIKSTYPGVSMILISRPFQLQCRLRHCRGVWLLLPCKAWILPAKSSLKRRVPEVQWYECLSFHTESWVTSNTNVLDY